MQGIETLVCSLLTVPSMDWVSRSVRIRGIGMAFISLVLTSCSSVSPAGPTLLPAAEDAFRQKIAIPEMNTHLKLEQVIAPDELPESRALDIMIMNISGEVVAFSPDYGVRLFALSEDEKSWREISNNVTYHGDGEQLEPQRGTDSDWATVVPVVPDRRQVGSSSVLRVVVEGRIASDGGSADSRVGAFLTLHLND